MSFVGTTINKNDGGLGGGKPVDRVSVLISGMAATELLPNNKAFELLQIEDAEALGLSATADKSAGTLVYEHLSEVFRLSPETPVHLITVPTTTKVSDLKNLVELKAALRSIDNVNTIAIAGLTADDTLQSAVSGAQLLVDNFAEEHILIDAVLIEGVGSYLTGEIATYPDLRIMDAPNVSVIIGQDTSIAVQHEKYNSYAAVGSALGMLNVRSVHENLGSVDVENKPRKRKGENDYTLSDSKLSKFLSASLSNGKDFSTLTFVDQKKLDELGYIYIGAFAGYGGMFFSDSHTCTNSDSDYCFIERNAVWNKAARIIRRVLIPRVRSKVESDPSTGFIKHTTITDWDGRVRAALESMVASGNVSAFDIYINPNQAAISSTPFVVRVRLVAHGIVHEFEIDLGYTTKL